MGRSVITDDERGVAQSLAEMLRRHGGRVALVRMDHQDGEVEPRRLHGEPDRPSAVAELLELVRRRQGPIAGLIHLLPLKAGTPFEEMDLAGWQDRLHLEVKSLSTLPRLQVRTSSRLVDGRRGLAGRCDINGWRLRQRCADRVLLLSQSGRCCRIGQDTGPGVASSAAAKWSTSTQVPPLRNWQNSLVGGDRNAR